MKILIVDDNADDRRLLKLSLEHYGCAIVEAVDGLDGLEKARTHKPDLIISDAMMPKMDGFQFLRTAKQDKNLQSIPFIFHTASYIGEKEKELALSLGAEAYIIKPKKPDDIWEIIKGIEESLKAKMGKPMPSKLLKEDEEYLKQYSQVVAAKLEEKIRDLEETKEEIEKREKKFCALMENSSDVILLISPDGNVSYISPSVDRLTGHTQEDMTGKNALVLVHPDDLANVPGIIKHGIEIPGFIGTVEFRYKHKNGSWRIFEAIGTNLLQDPSVNGIIINARDITERKKAEQRVIRLNRLYAVLSKANEAIVHIRKPEKLYQEVCRIIVDDGLFRMAWIGIVDPETLLVKPAAIYGHEDGYLKDKYVSVDESIPEGMGPTGIAIRTGGYFVCNDIEKDPLMEPWRDEALKRGYRSSAAFALKKAGEIIGTINVYSSMAYFFQEEEEVILFKSLAEDISYAIESMEIEKQRKQTEEALKESEGKYRVLFETSLDGIYQTDADNVFILINLAGAEIFGYKTPDEIIGRPVIDFWGEPKDREVFFSRLKRTKHVKSYPVAARKRDGETIHLEISSRILEDEQGGLLGVEGIIRDVTKRVKAENEIRQKVEDLENFYEMAVGRELKMKHLKTEIESLRAELSRFKKE